MPKHILIVEDEEDIQTLLSFNLKKEGYKTHSVYSGEQALKIIYDTQPDLILLDIMIPDTDGFEICKQLKSTPATSSIPIIFLSAKTQEHNIITGLELGADDYLTKPFNLNILIAKIRSLLRKKSKQHLSDTKTIMAFNDLILDTNTLHVTADNQSIALNNTEFKLLTFMAQKPGWVFSRQQLINACKGDDYIVTDRSIDVLIVAIRKKLGKCAYRIETVRGAGYRFKGDS